MIIDHIRNAAQYSGISQGLKDGLDYLAQTDFSKLAAGRYELAGDRLYAMVQEYDSKMPAEGKWEAHRRYIDIQYLVSGREIIGYADIETLEPAKDYDTVKDCQILRGQGSDLVLEPGMFMILLPQDAHMPGLAADRPAAVRKVVVKVRL
ncbi:MAG: YhcH/YjgK/YiaL family protein [Clostridiaceae bacterium]|nr:YhcH/YjgK/YiaL family protein [Clostridiaceae bacterium]